jgi:hypothetical protein
MTRSPPRERVMALGESLNGLRLRTTVVDVSEQCHHGWLAADLDLGNGDAVDWCAKCGEIRYVFAGSDDDPSEDDGPSFVAYWYFWGAPSTTWTPTGPFPRRSIEGSTSRSQPVSCRASSWLP